MTAILVLPLATAGAPWKWLGIPNHFPHAALDLFVIMPSHVHGIIVIADTAGTPPLFRLRRIPQGGKPLPPL